jgi:hypothetical protein
MIGKTFDMLPVAIDDGNSNKTYTVDLSKYDYIDVEVYVIDRYSSAQYPVERLNQIGCRFAFLGYQSVLVSCEMTSSTTLRVWSTSGDVYAFGKKI